MPRELSLTAAYFAGSARILITHQRQYLPQCSRVLVLRGGSIYAIGTPAELAPLKLPELQATEGDESWKLTVLQCITCTIGSETVE